MESKLSFKKSETLTDISNYNLSSNLSYWGKHYIYSGTFKNIENIIQADSFLFSLVTLLFADNNRFIQQEATQLAHNPQKYSNGNHAVNDHLRHSHTDKKTPVVLICLK